jgi:hypothetical protein
VSYTRVADLGPLVGLPLRWLDIACSQVANLAPLRGAPLEILDVGETAVADLAPCTGMQLNELYVDATAVADLDPIIWPGLTRIDCSRTQVRDLSGLARATGLRELVADGLPSVPRLGALVEHPPEFMLVDRAAIPDSWMFRDDRVHQVRQMLARDAVARSAWSELRGLAEVWRGRPTLILDCPMSREQAQQVAERAGARMWVPRDLAELMDVRFEFWRQQGIRPFRFAWFGVSSDLALADDGTPLRFRLPGIALPPGSAGQFVLPMGWMRNHGEPIAVYPPHRRKLSLSILEWPAP